MNKQKPKNNMELKKIIRESNKIKYTVLKKGRNEQEEEHKITAHDMPLPEFTKALESLSAVGVKLLDLTGNKSWEKELVCKGIESISVSKGMTRTIVLLFSRRFSHFIAPIEIKTPPFPIDELDGESLSKKKYPNINDEDIELIQEFIHQGIRYIDGNRSQGTLDLGDDDEYNTENNKPEEGDEFEFAAKSLEEKKFRDRIDACKTVDDLVYAVKDRLGVDWSGSGMSLKDLKAKAIEVYLGENSSAQ